MKQIGIAIAALGLTSVVGCAVAPGGSEMDAMAEEDLGSTVNAACNSMQEIYPLKAALAVSMAREMGRLDPVNDLWKGDRVYISWTGLSRCQSRGFGNCTNTQAILDLQLTTVNNYISQNTFSATTFREDLKASFDRQVSHENNLRMNYPSRVPQDHTLSQKGTFTAAGACGVHFDFWASGNAVNNIQERLVFFGAPDNQFLAFQSTAYTIAIDPTGTLNGDTGTTSGSTILACTSTNLTLKDKACTCNSKTGVLRPAPWNANTLYCAT